MRFWQHECQAPGISEACKANTQCSNSLRHCCGWLCREAQGWPQRAESHFLQCQLWHCSLYHYRATVVQSNSGERKGSDAPFGTRRWNRLFLIPLSNKGDGGSWVTEERRSCQGEKSHAGGAIPEKGARRRQEQLLVSRWWASAAQGLLHTPALDGKQKAKRRKECHKSHHIPQVCLQDQSTPPSQRLRCYLSLEAHCSGEEEEDTSTSTIVLHGGWTPTHGPGQLPQQSWTYS